MSDIVSHKPFVFICLLNNPLITTTLMLKLMSERHIDVESVSMMIVESGKARLIIHCRMERDRIGRTTALVRNIRGVIEADYMETKTRG